MTFVDCRDVIDRVRLELSKNTGVVPGRAESAEIVAETLRPDH
ncbi:hypothetical protein GPOL_c32040 [Gordonia polyisoprenivorans VH2]|uniref:Uncharacterized protein n=1 Tax=Gordonia polyisoprenivorans (strain DSM 44266 / VH2) TaxID=1112204 RepID=H6MXA1_GORPV|nr:hypothetical protein GPOL_c32040 [Gordonia polyisoprenivorans VH2]